MEPAPGVKRRSWLRILLAGVAIVLVLAGGAWLWLTAREEPPLTSNYRIDLAELRGLAASLPGANPSQVRSALVIEASLPRAAVFAGESFTPHPMVHQVFQLAR